MYLGTLRLWVRLLSCISLCVAVVAAPVIFSSPAQAVAGINQQINYQGRLFNAAGATVPDGYYNIQFKIYQDGDGQSVGNTTGSPAGSLLWTESHLNVNTQGVQIKNGFMSVELGSITPFGSSIDWNQDTLWVSLNIGSTNGSCASFAVCTPDGEMIPMKRLSAVPYSLNSRQLGGLSSSQFVQLAQGVQTDASSNTTSIYLNKTAGGNFFQLQSSGVDVFTVANAGDLTLGSNANKTISIATSAASTVGRSLTIGAGGGGTGTGSAGGDLVLQGGAAGGTNANGGNVSLNAGAKTGSGTDGTISIGTSNTSAINLGQDTTLAAGKSLTVTGGVTGTRPASPTEGMIYYDTTTKSLLTYANGKWQADRSTSTKIVAANNSSQALKDAADYVADGTGDQTEINAALTAASGGRVYLTEGTFLTTAVISIPNNTALVGSGRNSLIEMDDTDTTYNMIQNTDTTTGAGITIQNLRIDGRKDLNTTGNQYGIYLVNMGGGSGATTRQGAVMDSLWVNNFNSRGISLLTSNNNSIKGSSFFGSTGYQITLGTGSDQNTVTGNSVQSGGAYAVNINGASYNVLSSNTITGNTGGGVMLQTSANNNTLSDNTFRDNAGSSSNDSINLSASDSNTITGNRITDTAGSGYAINVSDSTSDTNYLSDNYFTGTGATTLNDAGTGTIFGGQVANSGNYLVQPAGTIELMKNTNVTGTLTASVSLLSPLLDTPSAGTLSIGTATASSVSIGKTSATTTVNGLLTVTQATALNGGLTVSNGGNVAFQRNTTDYSATGTQSDINFGTGVLFRITSASALTINSIAGGTDGRIITLVNTTATAVTIKQETGATAANRISTGTGTDVFLPADGSMQLTYDSGASRWRVLGAVASANGYVQLQGSTPGTAQSGNINITGTAIAATVQGSTSVLTPSLDTVSAGTLTIGGTTANAVSVSKAGVTTAINGNLSVAGSTVNIASTLADFPSGGAIGTAAATVDIYTTFNIPQTTTLQTLSLPSPTTATGGRITYVNNTGSAPFIMHGVTVDNGKSQSFIWNGTTWVPMNIDRAGGGTTKIVAPSNASPALKGTADYVATGTSDQTTINTALTAAAGGRVYLIEGTFNLSAAISIPNATTLSGAGYGTLITLPNAQNGTYNMIENTDQTTGYGVVIRDLRIDGNKANQTSGAMRGVYMNNMGDTASVREGSIISGIWVGNVRVASGSGAIQLLSGNYNTLLNNYVYSNNTTSTTGNGIRVNGNRNNVTNNIVHNNGGNGISMNGAGYSSVFANGIYENGAGGLAMDGNSSDNSVNSNAFRANGGSTTNEAISITGSTNNNVIANKSTDTNCTTTCYAIDLQDATAVNTFLSGNTYSGTAANPATINDAGTGTIYSGQADGSGNLINKSQGGGFAIGASSATSSLTVQGGITNTALTVPTLSATVTNTGTTGSTTRRYQITALDGTGETTGSTIQQTTAANATLSGSNYTTITWTPVGGAYQYRIYRCTGAACTPVLLATVAGNTASYDDIANGSPAGAVPSTNTTGNINAAANIQLAQGGPRTINVGTTSTNAAGSGLTVAAGAAGAGASPFGGGTLSLQGGAAAGTGNANGGDVTIDAGAKTGSGNDGIISLGATRASTIQIGSTTLSSGTQTINIGNNNTAGGTTNVTIGNGATATAGTTSIQAKDSVAISTNGVTRATFNNANSVYFGNGVTAAAPNAFTVSGTGSSTTAVAGGALTVQGGNATVGNANGGNLNLSGGTGFGTGVNGLVVIATPTFSTTANDPNCYTSGALVASTCTIAAASVNNSAAIIAGFSVSGQTANLPDPTTATAGRVVYITAANGSSDFTLSVNGGGTGNTIAMRQNTTATMIWNGTDWTAAGASSSTTLQSAYDNTLQSAGGAELVVSSTSNTRGLTIRDSTTNPVNGTLVSVQTSSAANLLSVNSNVTEYATNAGAETAGGTSTTFPASTWSVVGAGTATRYITAGNNISTGQASVAVTTPATVSTGVKNQLSTSLTANTTYNVSFTARLASGAAAFTTMDVIYSVDGTASSTTCTTGKTAQTSVWTKVNCTFTAPSSGITSSNAIIIRQSTATVRTFYVDNLSVTIAADYNYATDGAVNDSGNFATNWSLVNATTGAGSVTRSTTDGFDASDSASVTLSTGAANAGLRNKLSINPLPNTLYRLTVYGKLSSGTFADFKMRYAPTGSTGSSGTYIDCADYNTQILTTSDWTKVTCYITTDATAVTTPYVNFVETTSLARTFSVDAFSMTLASPSTPNVQIGGGINGGPTTLLTLDKGASAPIASDNEALLGSMYYDTTLGKLQCYEADGWGACGSSPDNVITISPEYTNAVLNGTGVGTMTSNICSDTLNLNDGSSGQPTICGANETYNFYKWTSPQSTAQTYSVYVTYQLPAAFKDFASGQTSLMGRTDSASSTVNYQVYRNSTSGLTACGSTVAVSTGSVSTWQTGVATGSSDPTTCSFAGGDSIVFKINVTASSNANAYLGNLNFTFSNR